MALALGDLVEVGHPGRLDAEGRLALLQAVDGGAASTARATRIASAVAASDSIARSASTLRISGCSMSFLPKAERWRV